jgi:serine/threonine protein kinase/Tfp pilus assembly protein PilF
MNKDSPETLPTASFPDGGADRIETASTLSFDSGHSAIPEVVPSQIGHYRLVRMLGEGGMGEVYEAEQLEPIRRKVALKLIRRGMDSNLVLSRFETERQSLALMNHVNIAQIYDGGLSEQGRPYFVMEYVSGIPIDRYCNEQRLGTRQRLELFRQLCEGIQHAHQKGIIHRDIKPSNVLVEILENRAVPKIIDFGVAKATHDVQGDATAVTQVGQIIGTPMYMSPEQVMGLDVDTRTDVYALGVLLYELLAGVHPLDWKRHPKRRMEEILQRICEEDPSRPSTQVGTLGEDALQVATQRGTDRLSLVKELRGDLDWITMKALEKDRARRYNSPSEFAADIERYLNNEPVLACPPSTAYRVRKFIRRHKVSVAAAAVVLLALLAGITGTTIGLIRAVRAEKAATEEAENARQVSDFLVRLFEVSDPSEARGNTVTAREILDRGVEKIEGELDDQPMVKAQMMFTMGRVYQSLGLYEQARPLLEKTLAIMRNNLGENKPALAQIISQLVVLYSQQGSYKEALPLAQEVLTIREEILGREHPDVAWALQNIGMCLREMGDYLKAQEYLERSLAIREKVLGPEHIDTAQSLYHLGWVFKLKGEYQKALGLYESALSIRESNLPEDHPEIARNLNDLCVLHLDTVNYDKALEILQRSLAIREKIYGHEHPEVADSLENIGTTFCYLGKYKEAKPYDERALAIREKVLGPESPKVAGSLNNLALLFRNLGKHHEALPLYKRALAIFEKTLGPGHPDVAMALTNIALLQTSLKSDFNEIRELLERALAIREKAQGSEHPEVANTLKAIAFAYETVGNYDQAMSFYRKALTIRKKVFGDVHPDTASIIYNIADLEISNSMYEEARRLLEQTLTTYEKALGRDHPDSYILINSLADLERRCGNYEKAQSLYERALRIQGKAAGSAFNLYSTLEGLARLHLARNEIDKAKLLFNRAIESLIKDRGEENATIPFHRARHSALLGDRDQAIHFLRRAVELGYCSPNGIAQHSDLAPLHGNPEFEVIVAEAKKCLDEK